MGPGDQSRREYAKECPLPLASAEPFPAKLGGGGKQWEAGAWPAGGQHVRGERTGSSWEPVCCEIALQDSPRWACHCVSGTFLQYIVETKTVQYTTVITARGAHLVFMNALYISFQTLSLYGRWFDTMLNL